MDEFMFALEQSNHLGATQRRYRKNYTVLCRPPARRILSHCWRRSLPTWATRKTASRRWPRPTPWWSNTRNACGKRKSSPPGRLAPAAAGDATGGGGSLVAAGPGRRPPPGGEIAGAAGRHEPRPACGSSRASAPKPASCWRRSMAGSPRALTPPTSRRPRRCWRSWGNRSAVYHTA